MAAEIDMFMNSDYGNSALIENMLSLISKKGKGVKFDDPKALLDVALFSGIALAKDKDKPIAFILCQAIDSNNVLLKDSLLCKFVKEQVASAGMFSNLKSKLGVYGLLEVKEFITKDSSGTKYLKELLDKLNETSVYLLYYGGKDKKYIKLLKENDFSEVKIGSRKYLLRKK